MLPLWYVITILVFILLGVFLYAVVITKLSNLNKEHKKDKTSTGKLVGMSYGWYDPTRIIFMNHYPEDKEYSRFLLWYRVYLVCFVILFIYGLLNK